MNFLGAEFEGDIREVSTKALAYVGDAVFELFCRTEFSFNNSKVRERVNAKAQAECFDKIELLLNKDEEAIAMRGRNLKTPRSKEPFYRKATAFESVIGYLFLIGKEKRLSTLLKCCMERSESTKACKSSS